MEIDTVRDWIDRARQLENGDHLKVFWTAMDAMEGMEWHKADKNTVDYIKANVRQSPARDAVVKKLEAVLATHGVP